MREGLTMKLRFIAVYDTATPPDPATWAGSAEVDVPNLGVVKMTIPISFDLFKQIETEVTTAVRYKLGQLQEPPCPPT